MTFSRLSALFEDRVQSGVINDDPAQRAALPQLDAILTSLSPASPASKFKNIWRASVKTSPRGLYLWGDVGRGKSMLMDMMFDAAPIKAKRRVHFHAFLLQLHAAIHAAQLAGSRDPIADALTRAADGLRLLALDEIDVNDIADAMIIDRVFRHLFKSGVVMIATSNRPPDLLYRHGLNRDLFLPLMNLLKTQLDVVQLQGSRDWRHAFEKGDPVYFWPLDELSAAAFDQLWSRAGGAGAMPRQLDISGRSLSLPLAADRIGRASFVDLCEAPLGPADYQAIAGSLDCLFLDEVPQLGPKCADALRRLVVLVDELYEAECGLVIRAAVAESALVAPEMNSFSSRRLISRLIEMQSGAWGVRELRA